MRFVGCDLLLIAILLSSGLTAVGQSNSGSVSASAPTVPLTAEDRTRIAAIREQAAPALTVSDLIGLTTVDSTAFSLNGEYIAVVISRGDLTHNTLDAKILVYRTAELQSNPRPVSSCELSAVSDAPIITGLKWLTSNEEVAFLGQQGEQLQQVYVLDIRTNKLRQVSHSPTKVRLFIVTDGGDFLYAANPPASKPEPAEYAAMRARGFAVDPEIYLANFVRGEWQRVALWDRPEDRPLLRMAHKGQEKTILQLPHNVTNFSVDDANDVANYAIRLSPAGGKVLTTSYIALDRPWWETSWGAFRNVPPLDSWYRQKDGHLHAWMVTDLRTGISKRLLDAPTTYSPTIWPADGKSVIIVNAILPLNSPDPAENAARAKQRMTAEIDLNTGKVLSVITREPLPNWGSIDRWDRETATLTVNPRDKQKGKLTFRKTASGWIEVPASEVPAVEVKRLRLEVVSTMNEPWKLVVVDARTQEKHLVFDPNPGLLEKRRVARVTELRWQSKTGIERSGLLYWPVDYVEGQRYPLFIQTHGGTGGFSPSGWSTTGCAAQPLAGAGMFVLQMGTGGKNMSEADKAGAREGAVQQEGIEAAIDYLDGLGLIDRSKVGLQGFSLTDYHVLYTLTHSKYAFAAATINDGQDGSYFQFMLVNDKFVGARYGEYNGGPPYGAGLKTWLERAPGFNLDRITAPLLATSMGGEVNGFGGGPFRVAFQWEPVMGLLMQGRPAELVYFHNGAHELVKPWERYTSQQNCTVDWYRFWLQGYERKEPVAEAGETKEDLQKQYARWHKLRDMRDAKRRESES